MTGVGEAEVPKGAPFAWPPQLVDEIRAKACVIVLGAGTSVPSRGSMPLRPGAISGLASAPKFLEDRRPPLWGEFLDYCAMRLDAAGCEDRAALVRRFLAGKNYLDACEVAKRGLSELRHWDDALEVCFKAPGYSKSDLTEIIFRLDQRVVLTFNVDTIYPNFVRKETENTTNVLTYASDQLARKVRSREPIVVAWHGSVDETQGCVFTRSDYARLRLNYPAFYAAVEALYATSTFLFIGCGPDDPDMRLLFENLSSLSPGAPFHYFVSPNGEIDPLMDEVYRDLYNLSVLRYDPTGEHAALVIAMSGLAELGES